MKPQIIHIYQDYKKKSKDNIVKLPVKTHKIYQNKIVTERGRSINQSAFITWTMTANTYKFKFMYLNIKTIS